jgi:hypothetical protein
MLYRLGHPAEHYKITNGSDEQREARITETAMSRSFGGPHLYPHPALLIRFDGRTDG